MALELNFNRGTKVYYPGEVISVECIPTLDHVLKAKDISINIVCLLLRSSKTLKYNNLIQYENMRANNAVEIRKININTKDFPLVVDRNFVYSFDFSIPDDENTIETFHGTHIYVEYFICFNFKMGFLRQDIAQAFPFTVYNKPVEMKPSGPPIDEIIDYCDSNSPYKVDFKCRIYLESPIISPKKPPHGYIIIEDTRETISQVSITFLVIEKFTNEKNDMEVFQTETNWTNIAEFDPLQNREIPFFVEWERKRVSQTLFNSKYMISISYALRININWEYGAHTTYDIPVILYRDLKY